ncbi:TetR/AcrR family transcriptional regulator [Nocardia sp. N2S4-5]|uniref:TetR/AcrR family transcriptional regulator n=1 Tax=Nocardia sp. N2S4-5 TaxID=3351565 RepID=UPI0037D6CF45
MTTVRRPNRGPAAAAANRVALIGAAREVLTEYGADAPMALIAQRAGVGKGSLYRHFPTRADVIVAVFEDIVRELERFAAEADSTAWRVIGAIVEQLVASVAFIAVLDPGDSSDGRLYEPGQRVIRLLKAKLAEEDLRGGLRADLTVDEVFVGISMLAGLLHKTPTAERPAAAERGWALLTRAFYAVPSDAPAIGAPR